ncbi:MULTISPECIES: zinc ribbon domain-containing protein [unclassified Shewanella]|uniref:zinc ribbon domain-containing protein n=1 Tax=unclassified Shewanella TaxID=196818 RepID=UPI0006D67A42|nr:MULTISPECIES: zinc ribbon domain-containing protein [unclassified Shewanella]KPZ70858.1 hypothetical protein AN944_01956 [Shewanella sp. P1-14-1]
MDCPYCKTSIASGAVKCAACLSFLSGHTCPDCSHTLPEGAKVCGYCHYRFSQISVDVTQISMHFTAEVLASLLFRFRLLPQEIITDEDKITINSPGIFRLWNNTDEVPWNKIAGFNYRSGIIWDKIEIETRGQKPSIILGLSKQNSDELRKVLQSVVNAN